MGNPSSANQEVARGENISAQGYLRGNGSLEYRERLHGGTRAARPVPARALTLEAPGMA
jgi:hypothetical protein